MKMNPLSYKSVSECTLCPNLGKDHVPAVGSRTADLMIVGQSPGVSEVQLREPFVGACGDMVDYMLDEAELDRQSVYITNALKCHPPGNRVALAGELSNCWRTWLFQEIRLVDPALILILGADAHKSVLPKGKEFGHLIEHQSKSRIYLSSYHPGWFIRKGASGMEQFIAVGGKIKEILENLSKEIT